jgi:ketosteroid isomerase-like protein
MMNKKFLLLPAIILPASLFAQRSVGGLVNAERSFAAYAVVHGTKDAFLKFADSTGIVFENGKPVNAIEAWNKREKRPGVLNWHPQFAEIASSNDFGFTTGPWTLSQTVSDTPLARGQYTTVWQVNKNGEWKFLIDLGVGNVPANQDTSLTILKKPDKVKGNGSLLESEEKFIAAITEPVEAYKKYLSENAIVNRNGLLPQYGQWKNELFSNNMHYTINGSGLASTGDLGYVYGTTNLNGKVDNYLRLWRKEKDGWKIVLEVLRY